VGETANISSLEVCIGRLFLREGAAIGERDWTTARRTVLERVALQEYRDKLAARRWSSSRRGLVIKWSREPGYLFLHDSTTGEWHEVKASECPPSIVESAKAHRRRRGQGR
jgi:hypothetical protein